jgi:hypothetical protein
LQASLCHPPVASGEYGAELWWKGEDTRGTGGRAEDLQKLVNQKARTVTGCLRTTNLGALMMESEPRPATAQLENRQRRFRLRLLSLGRLESTVLVEDPKALDATTLVEDEAAAKTEAERTRPGLTMFTDGSRLDSGAAGQRGTRLRERGHIGWVTRFIWGLTRKPMMRSALFLQGLWKQRGGGGHHLKGIQSSQTVKPLSNGWLRKTRDQDRCIPYSQETHCNITKARPDITIEIRWCPAHKGVPGNEKAGEWAKLAAEEPDTRGVEWLRCSDRYRRWAMHLPRSLAHLKREISERKWVEARRWAARRITGRKYRLPGKQLPDGTSQ